MRPFWWPVAALVVAVLTALAYANASPSVFVLDDKLTVPPNLDRGLGAIPAVFSETAWAAANTSVATYRPLLVASFLVEGALWSDRAAAMHRTNVALHVIVTLLLLALLVALQGRYTRRTSERTPTAIVVPALAALFFGLHPIHTEIVDSVFNRSEMMATAGVLGALWLLVQWVDRRPLIAWTGTALLYLVALLSRESAVSLPVLALLVVATLPFEGNGNTLQRRLAPVVLLGLPLALYAVLRQHALTAPQAAIGRIVLEGAPSAFAPERIAQAAVTLRESTRMMVWPHPLRASYADLGVDLVGPTILCLLAIVLLAAAAWREQPALAAGIGFFYLALLPSTRLIGDPGGIELAAERYLYLPSVGVSIALLSSAVVWRYGRAAAAAALAAATVVLVVAGIATHRRNTDWRSEEALWRAQVAVAPRDGDGWMQLTTELLRLGKNEEIVGLCRTYLPQNTGHAQFHNNCATAAMRTDRFNDAETYYRQAIALGAGAVGHANLARMLARVNRMADAEVEYRAAIEAEPNEAMRHVRRGELLLRTQADGGVAARAEFDAALAMDPNFPPARQWLERLGR